MIWLHRLLLWLSPEKRRLRARELDEELQANLALAREEGAGRDFGNLAHAREEARAVWFPGWDHAAADVRYAARMLRRSPGFTTVAVLSLALGIGSATALFSLVDTIVLKPLAYREPGRLMFVREVVPPLAHIYPSLPVNYQHYRFWREQSSSFESLAAVSGSSATWGGGGEPEVVGAARITANLFDVLGALPQAGRWFTAEEEQKGHNDVAIVTDGFWRRRLGGSASVIGQTIVLDGRPHTVAGVLPPSFRFPRNNDLGPLAHLSERTEVFRPIGEYSPGWGGDFDYIVFGRLRPGVSQGRAGAELDLLENRIVKQQNVSKGLHVQIRPLQDAIASPVRTSLGVLLAAVLVLVLIVCVNLANLLLARGSARAREFSLRIALGASRVRLLSSALVETLLLAVAGGALGIAAARIAIGWFVHTSSAEIPRLDEVHLDLGVAAFGFGLALVCGLLVGLLPALRLSGSDPQGALRAGSQTMSEGRRGLRMREWLVGGEVALSALLLVLAVLLTGSLWRVLRVDRGFTANQAVAAGIQLPGNRYRTQEQRDAVYDLLLERLRALPGVRSTALASRLPLTGESNVNHIVIEGAAEGALDPETRQLLMINVRFVTPDYFAALGIPVVQGRSLEPADLGRNVALISARLAARLWPGQSPLGRVIISSGSGVNKVEIVGVVSDVYATQLDRDPTMMVYVYWKRPQNGAEVVVRGSTGTAGLMAEIRRTVWSIDSSIPIPKIRTMDEIVEQTVAGRRFQMRVAGAFGLSALLLAALGIYGVVAYGVALRRREIGIRLALGARPAQVRRAVVTGGLRPVVAGLAVGMLAALATGKWIRGLLFGVAPYDPVTLGAVAAALALVAVMGCLLPAGSATRMDPARVLREE